MRLQHTESPMPLRSLLLSLHSILTAAEGGSSLGSLPREHRRILTYVARRVAEGDEICIGDVTACRDLGASLTISRRLGDLETQGWIQISDDRQNHRRRLIGLIATACSAMDAAGEKAARDLSTVVHLLKGAG
jgi:hypothetical protein